MGLFLDAFRNELLLAGIKLPPLGVVDNLAFSTSIIQALGREGWEFSSQPFHEVKNEFIFSIMLSKYANILIATGLIPRSFAAGVVNYSY